MRIRHCAMIMRGCGLVLALIGFVYILQTVSNISALLAASRKAASQPDVSTESPKNETIPVANSSSSPIEIPAITTKLYHKFRVNARAAISQYSIQPLPCDQMESNITLVIMIISAPSHYTLRQAIRKTWGSLADGVCGVRRMFVFGRVYVESLQQSLNEESLLHKDILQSNQFDDTYRASSLKTLHMYQWAAAFCPDSMYVARIDDDEWLNVPKFYNFIQTKFGSDEVLGLPFGANSTIIRDASSKYYIPREEYAGDRYPNYLSGMLFTYPTRLLPRLLHISKQHAGGVFLDDVFIAGILTNEANYTKTYHPDYAMDPHIDDTNCPKRDRVSIHYVKLWEIYALWDDPCFRYEEIC